MRKFWFGVFAVCVMTAGPAGAAGAPGEEVYKQVCATCHATGVAGAPKLGDKAAWAPRLKSGIESMYTASLKGKGAMPPKGGSMATPDGNIKAAVDFMVSKSK